jgi:hypothetical protein
MSRTKIKSSVGYIDRPLKAQIDLKKSQVHVINYDYHCAALARKRREVLEFLATLPNKSAAK